MLFFIYYAHNRCKYVEGASLLELTAVLCVVSGICDRGSTFEGRLIQPRADGRSSPAASQYGTGADRPRAGTIIYHCCSSPGPGSRCQPSIGWGFGLCCLRKLLQLLPTVDALFKICYPLHINHIVGILVVFS